MEKMPAEDGNGTISNAETVGGKNYPAEYVVTIVKDLHNRFGFDLTNIERVALRKISEKVEEDRQLILKRGGMSHSDYEPTTETLCRFFLQYYGIHFNDAMKTIKNENGETDFKGFGDYLRKKQDEAHLL